MLWHLRPLDHTAPPWAGWVSVTRGVIVRAPCEESARKHAAKAGGHECRNRTSEENPWLDPTLTTCEPLLARGKRGIVMVESR